MSNESGKKPVVHKKHVARLQREQQQTRIILYIFFAILAGVVLLLVYGWLDINYLQLNRAVAKVGESKILVKDFEPRVRLQRQNLLNQHVQYQQYAQYFGMDFSTQLQQIEFQLASSETLGQGVLDQMIDEQIVRLEAEKRGITIGSEELDESIQSSFGFFPNGTPTATVTPTEMVLPENPPEVLELVTATPRFTATPAATATAVSEPTATLEPTVTPTAGPTATPFPTSTPLTEDGYQTLLSDTDENLAKFGFSKEYYRTFYENQLLRTKVRDAVVANVANTEPQVWARHILVEDEVTARGLIEQIQSGMDFAELARDFSIDTGSGAQGGDLGWFGAGMMVAEFETAAFALENPGDITTEPVQSEFGFHIIQLIAKQERPLSAEQYEQAVETAFQEWLAAAREEYGVEVYDIWKQRVPSEPNFITAATEAAGVSLTAQAEQLATFEAGGEGTPQP